MQAIMTQVHIADIHFGCIDPMTELDILKKQFLDPISRIGFDILSIDGDLFDRRMSANSSAVACAIEFVNRCAMLCKMRDAALIMISGTESHEANQLSLFYDLAATTGVEVHIVEHIQFVNTHGAKILCIPEEYGKGAGYYENFLKETYDFCFLHGSLVGGFPTANQECLDSKREPTFSIDSFSGCKGPIIAGHVHTAMCLQNYMYYVSSPIRWKFGEEKDKGYGILLSNRLTGQHMYQFMKIDSFKYETIGIDALSSLDPNDIINQLNMMKQSGIDYIRLNCTGIPVYAQQILIKYINENRDCGFKTYNTTRANSNGELVDTTIDQSDLLQGKIDKMGFLLDDSIANIAKFVMYINANEGKDIISVDQLKLILSGS